MIKKILLVDDSPVARKIMLHCMPKDRGYEFHEGVNGEDGVAKFAEIQPDVTFLDITMPIMDGFQVLEKIKGVDREAVVVICTADIQPKSLARANELGALTVVRKPPTKEAIVDVLSRADDALAAVKKQHT